VRSRRSVPRNLAGGSIVLAVLVVLALIAPLLATDRPWLSRDDGKLSAPVLRSQRPGPLSGTDREDTVLLRAPIPHHPDRIDLSAVLQPPGRGHWLGTDPLGRDLAARMLHGARVSLGVGLLAAAFALVVGVPLGAWAGYRGGWADAVVGRCVETVLCFPALLLVLAVLVTAPDRLRALPDVARIAVVLGLTGWVPVARYLRAEFLKLRDSDMVVAARSTGGGHLRIVVRHILPSALAPVLVTAAFAVGAAIALEAALSFLGLGVRPPTATWGGLLSDAREHVDRAWWLALFPGIALFLAVLGCNLVGEGIRDMLDPRARRR
jgi:peptide/nickel transport system permease protein